MIGESSRGLASIGIVIQILTPDKIVIGRWTWLGGHQSKEAQ